MSGSRDGPKGPSAGVPAPGEGRTRHPRIPPSLMATKRVFEIAKEQGLSSREVVTRLKEAGLDVSAAASTVDEAEALKVLANGSGPAVEEKPRPVRRRAAPKPKAEPKPK